MKIGDIELITANEAFRIASEVENSFMESLLSINNLIRLKAKQGGFELSVPFEKEHLILRSFIAHKLCDLGFQLTTDEELSLIINWGNDKENLV